MYGSGRGVAQDDAEAVQWYRKAAEQGDAEAQYRLGLMYDIGEDVAEDDAEAVQWYRKAAEQGHAKAQYSLGVMYANGEGVSQHFVMAHMWLNLSRAQGEDFAKGGIELLVPQMTREQIAEAQGMARKWQEKHSASSAD